MKIRNHRLIAAAGWLGTRCATLLFRTLRFQYQPLGSNCAPAHLKPDARHIYCIWHENLLLPTIYFGCPEIAVLISRHADGKLLGSLVTALGMGMVEGSTTRGGVEAVRRLTRSDSPWRHLAVTPDGPRGPRRIVQAGITYVASRTGLKIVPVGVGYHGPWRMQSWDRFALPKPFSRARIVTGEPMTIPDGLNLTMLETHRLRVQAEMDRVHALAESWAETGRLTLPTPTESHKLAS